LFSGGEKGSTPRDKATETWYKFNAFTGRMG